MTFYQWASKSSQTFIGDTWKFFSRTNDPLLINPRNVNALLATNAVSVLLILVASKGMLLRAHARLVRKLGNQDLLEN